MSALPARSHCASPAPLPRIKRFAGGPLKSGSGRGQKLEVALVVAGKAHDEVRRSGAGVAREVGGKARRRPRVAFLPGTQGGSGIYRLEN